MTEQEIAVSNKSVEELEAFLFAFIWNRATFPMGSALGKSEEEIADKTLEVMEKAQNMVDVPVALERLARARARRERTENVNVTMGGVENDK